MIEFEPYPIRTVIQAGFEPNNPTLISWRPYNKLARVVKTRPAAKTIDVAFVDGSGVAVNVPVIVEAASTRSGLSYLPDTNLEDDDYRSEGNGRHDMYAVISNIHGDANFPICIGFKHPEDHQASFSNDHHPNMRLERHESDRYSRIVGDALKGVPCEEEHYWPDGSYMKVYDTDSGLTDLSGKNEDAKSQPWSVKSDDSPKGFILKHPTGAAIHITPAGEINIAGANGESASVSGGTVTWTASRFVFNGPCTWNGTITVPDDDVVAQGKSLVTHRHGQVQSGSSQTGAPV